MPFLNCKHFNSGDSAVICGGRIISYTQLLSAIGPCAARLHAAGIRAGDRIALVSPNSAEYIILLLCLWSIKAIACPISIRLPAETLDDQIHQINARFLITSEDHLIHNKSIAIQKIDLLKTIGLQVTLKEQSPVTELLGNDVEPPSTDLSYDGGQYATILFTSGSGGYPKAVLHTLDNHIQSAKGSNELIPISRGDQWLLSLPLYHVGGLSILFRTLLFGGVIVIPKSDESISKAIEIYSLTHVSLVSTQLVRLLNDQGLFSRCQKLKCILIGGSAIPRSLLEKSLEAGLPIYTTYGSTELASQIATAKFPSTAKILSGRKIMISNEGEILANGETLFSGYVHGNTVDLPLNEQGWFATGDMGHLDDEGGLAVTGRKDNMFISGGENIHPEEVERSLCQMDFIQQAIVVPVESSEFGYRPVAFIKTLRNTNVKKEDLYRFLEHQLPKFKIPTQFYVWPPDSPAKHLKTDRRFFMKKARNENASLTTIN